MATWRKITKTQQDVENEIWAGKRKSCAELEAKGFQWCGEATGGEIKKLQNSGLAFERVASNNYKYHIYMKPGADADQVNRALSYGFKNYPV